MADAVQLDNEDFSARLLLLYWLCSHGEWDLVNQQLKKERNHYTKMDSAHYAIILEIVEILVALHEVNNRSYIE